MKTETAAADLRGKEEARSNDELEDVLKRPHRTAQQLHSQHLCRLNVILEHYHQLAADADQNSRGPYITTHQTTPHPFYGPFSGTTHVSRCQKKTSGLHGARED